MQTTHTYAQIAKSFALWGEYVDTAGLDSRETFDTMTEAEKIAVQVACFGPEKAAMQAAHTPGPWTVNRSVFSTSNTAEDHIGTPSHTCAVVYTDLLGGQASEHKANAQLIASAPDMLAFLRGLAKAKSESTQAARVYCDLHLDAAIAKAEGRA
jgi:hypothetical protein